MKTIKQYWIPIIILGIITILVIIRSFGVNHFKPDAKKWAESSIKKTNIATPEMIKSMGTEILLVYLDKNQSSINTEATDIKTVNITPEEILIKNNLNLIRKNSGPVILLSSDPALGVRMWMVLSQMGIKNLYILSGDGENESFKNEFRPDTISKPEFQEIL